MEAFYIDIQSPECKGIFYHRNAYCKTLFNSINRYNEVGTTHNFNHDSKYLSNKFKSVLKCGMLSKRFYSAASECPIESISFEGSAIY